MCMVDRYALERMVAGSRDKRKPNPSQTPQLLWAAPP